MGHKLENVEKNTAKLTIEVSAKEFDDAISKAYIKSAKRFNVPGFRKGKAPKKMIEKMYGEGVFYEDAVNLLIPDAYDNAVEESGIHPVDQPEIDVVTIEAGKPFVFTATVTVKPEVKLGEYKGVTIEKVSFPVTDADVDAELKKMQEQNARIISVEGRPAKDGDMTVIDFEGFIGDKAFEGGKGTDYSLTLGSGAFIPGFEKQIEGKNVGETFDVNVTFPEEYHAEELKGADAVFKVTLKDLKEKELPALDDEFAKDSDFDTLEDLKADILAKLKASAERSEKQQVENLVLAQVTENAEMDIPECMVKNQVEKMVTDYDYRLRSQGIPLEQYLRYTGQTIDQLKEQMKEPALVQVRTDLVLDKISEVEKISATDADVDAELEKMAEQYSMELDKVKELMAGNLDSLKFELVMRKTIDMLVAESKQSDKAPAKKTTAKKTTETAEKKPATKKATTKKADDAAEKKPAAKKTSTKAAATKTTTAKKPAAKKTTKKEETK